jgi:aspartyl-tRNA(Asn)/glutamyl-tRNA(Gln) amidotransferase subunit B
MSLASTDTGWTTRIGLEVHVRLATRSKLFCACPNRFETQPNVHICPVCTGQPGSLPALGKGAVLLAMRAATLFGFTIAPKSRFDRKHYFYPDLPKGYQITQEAHPLGRNGSLEIETPGRRLAVPLRRIHIEEDAGRSVHTGTWTQVDCNRAGTPLVEIVTDPVLESAEEVAAFLRRLREELRFAGVSDGDMDKGSMRADVNVSVHRVEAGQDRGGVRVEIKNLNSIRSATDAVAFEIERQVQTYESRPAGEAFPGGAETRRFVPQTTSKPAHTVLLRRKEGALDYRFLEDPDLAPLLLNQTEIEAVRTSLPAGPLALRDRWRLAFDLSEYDTQVLTQTPQRAAYFQAVVACFAHPDPKLAKAAANWITNDLLATEGGLAIVQPSQVAELVQMLSQDELSHKGARSLLGALVQSISAGRIPSLRNLSEELGLVLSKSPADLDAWAREAIAARPDAVDAWRAGRTQAVDALVGAAMAASRGKASPGHLRGVLLAALADLGQLD